MICEIVLTGRGCVGLMLLFFVSGYLLILGILSEVTVEHTNDVIYSSKNLTTTNWKPPGRYSDHLHVFVQISDLHLSAFQEKERGDDLLEFCLKTLNIIRPEVVMLTGDITDAKLENHEGSRQILDEWIDYQSILNRSNILNRTVWLDTRGNHDTFDVSNLKSKDNLFRKYSVRGSNGQLSYHYKHKSNDGDVISFIAVDAGLDPGPKRPFNFFGMLKDSEMTKLKGFIEESSKSNATIFFGHYPSSVISSHSSKVIRNLFSNGVAYLCGHLHTFAGMMTQMYAYQREGYLELELGDWKHERLYRVMALDHGLFSFVDIPMNKHPVVLVTNPKDERFVVWGKEPQYNIEESSHIRMLIFSPYPIKDIHVTIDGSIIGEVKHVKDSLYVLPWDAKSYKTGFHYIEVTATDSSGETTRIKQGFSLDGSYSGFTFIQRFILVMDHTLFFKSFFAFMYVLAVLPLVFFKLFRVQIIAMSRHRFSSVMLRCFQRWLRRFCLLASRNKIFYPLLAYNIYLVSGPWFIGHLLSDHIGACFLYGLIVDGHFLQTSLTYLYGALQMMQFNIPLTFYLAYALDCTISKQNRGNEGCVSCLVGRKPQWFFKSLKHTIDHLFFFIIILFQAYLLFSGFLKSYGFVAFLVCPMRTWAIVLALFLHYITVRNNSQNPDRLIASVGNSKYSDESHDNNVMRGLHEDNKQNSARIKTPTETIRHKISLQSLNIAETFADDV